MYRTRIPKSQQGPKKTIVLYRPENISLPDIAELNNQSYIQIFSVDPGTKNYALRIERRYNDGQIETRVMELINLVSEEETEDIAIESTYFNLFQTLNSYWSEIKLCQLMIVERQIPPNYNAIRIQTATMDYLMSRWGQYECGHPYIFDIDPKFKNRQFGVGDIGKKVKCWGIKTALLMLRERRDEVALAKFIKAKKITEFYHYPLNPLELSPLPQSFMTKGKKDDLTDTVVQIEAICLKFKIGLFRQRTINHGPLVLSINTDNQSDSSSSNRYMQLTPSPVVTDYVPIQAASSQPQLSLISGSSCSLTLDIHN